MRKHNMSNRTTIRLTENDLNNLIAEAATRMINELDKKTYAMAAKKALDRSMGDENAGKASKAMVRKVVKRLSQDNDFLNLSPDKKLEAIKYQLQRYYDTKARKLAAKASDDKALSMSGIDKLAKSILANYFYDENEGKWKASDMPDIGVDYSSLYDDQLF